MPYDLAIRPRVATGRCDLVATPAGLVLDGTPLSAMQYGLLTRRRARRDDRLPADMPEDPATPATLNARQGSAGDALDPRGDLTGSRLWLLARAKKPEALQRAAGMARNALAPLERRGLTVSTAVADGGPGRIHLTARAGTAQVTLPVLVGS
ncbi:phage GP46 family protein [Roseomonas sp. HJA6]|uniref:Phage GP46 family protein n=1 Tax=Roseomonas alba TaxID=2846776 RepID=A0ABS7AIE6_9PROT|nr:phage GP46 family protein [Neoroseomonas alba]MBW6402026.1 phage GP46 family protein [Neoroseomonas alba]